MVAKQEAWGSACLPRTRLRDKGLGASILVWYPIVDAIYCNESINTEYKPFQIMEVLETKAKN